MAYIIKISGPKSLTQGMDVYLESAIQDSIVLVQDRKYARVFELEADAVEEVRIRKSWEGGFPFVAYKIEEL